MHARQTKLLCVLSALCAFACAGGQTGEENNYRCREQREQLTLEQVSPLGVSAQHLLDMTGGGFWLPLTWQALGDLDYGPESGPSMLTLRLENARDPVYVASEYRAPPGLDQLPCADSLLVTVDATLSSEGGALEESFSATLTAQNEQGVFLIRDFDPAKLGGSLSLHPTASSSHARRITLQIRWDEIGASGRLVVGIEQQSAGTTGFRVEPLACIGATDSSGGCGH